MTIEALQEKLKRWGQEYPKAAKAYYRSKAREIKSAIQNAYSGVLIGRRTGALRRSVGYKANRYGFLVSVSSNQGRRHVARMLEQGFMSVKGKRKIPGKSAWVPLRDKVEKELAEEIMNKILGAYT